MHKQYWLLVFIAFVSHMKAMQFATIAQNFTVTFEDSVTHSVECNNLAANSLSEYRYTENFEYILEAKGLCSKAIELYDKNFEAHFNVSLLNCLIIYNTKKIYYQHRNLICEEIIFHLNKVISNTQNNSFLKALALHLFGLFHIINNQDIQQAKEYFEKAMAQGYDSSIYALACLHEIDDNKEKALELYNLSREKGIQQADEAINRLINQSYNNTKTLSLDNMTLWLDINITEEAAPRKKARIY